MQVEQKNISKLPKELCVDESKHGLFKDLAESDLFEYFDAPFKEVFMYAMAIGFSNRNSIPLRKRRGTIPTRNFGDYEKWFLNSLAVSKERDLEVLFDISKVVNIAEEYANGGIDNLYNTITKHGGGDIYKIMDTHAVDEIRKKFENESDHSTTESDKNLLSMISGGETETVEFKSSLLWDYKNNNVNKNLGMVIAKSIVCFLNSKLGGSLIIGVADDKKILGLDNDFKYSPIRKHDEDGFQLKLNELIEKYAGKISRQFIHVKFENVDNKTVCIIDIEKAPIPTYLINEGRNEFYVRIGNSCQQLDARDANQWISTNWKT